MQLHLCRNGSKINGVVQCNLDTEVKSVTLVYVDGTRGWKDIQDSTVKCYRSSILL